MNATYRHSNAMYQSNPMRVQPLAAAICGLLLPIVTSAQTSPASYQVLPYEIESGYLDNPTNTEAVVFQETVTLSDRDWVRLKFEFANLPSGSGR